MTKDKPFKRRVRERMSKTGERYTAARRQLLVAPPEPSPADGPAAQASELPAGAARRGPSDEVLATRTGRPWDEWRALLDASAAAEQPHPRIVRWLIDEQGVDGWWAQTLAVRYEQHIGRRVPGQRSRGVFAASGTRTIDVPAERAFDAFVDDQLRARWLPDLQLTLRTANRPRSARFNVADGSERLIVGIDAKGERCTVSIEHERLPDATATDAARARWRERLAALKQQLEG